MGDFSQNIPAGDPWSIAAQATSGISSYAFLHPAANQGVLPRVDIVDADGHIVYLFELPGADPDKIDLEVSPGELTVRAPLETAEKYAKASFLYQERPKGTFFRLLTPPANVDLENISADYRHGLLEVRFPKKQRT
ncbi:MAG: Hsp20/alpha crystallin family protein [Armatimonadetes bacterium]|nr:Hsp20/alpha crystallin family protein [Armatimonadota bacterium]